MRETLCTDLVTGYPSLVPPRSTRILLDLYFPDTAPVPDLALVVDPSLADTSTHQRGNLEPTALTRATKVPKNTYDVYQIYLSRFNKRQRTDERYRSRHDIGSMRHYQAFKGEIGLPCHCVIASFMSAAFI